MKKQSLSISVPEPCHENWSQMTPVEKGRHCASCQKTVIDFTRMPKSKIAEFIKNSKGSTCGRFTSDQLNIELITPKPSKSWLKYAAIFLGLIPFSGYSQKSDLKTAQTHMKADTIKGEWVEPSKLLKGKINLFPSNISHNFKGKLVDKETGEALLFGTVCVYNSVGNLITGIETDIDGNFVLSDIKDAKYLEASYIGYEYERVYIQDLKSFSDIKIELREGVLMDPAIVVGLMITNVEQEHHEEEINDDPEKVDEEENAVEDLDHPIFYKMYPNPTSDMVSIEVRAFLSNGTIQITGINGELILERPYAGHKIDLDLSPYPSGHYIISIIQDKQLLKSETIIKK